jgi:hypothetical protein
VTLDCYSRQPVTTICVLAVLHGSLAVELWFKVGATSYESGQEARACSSLLGAECCSLARSLHGAGICRTP